MKHHLLGFAALVMLTSLGCASQGRNGVHALPSEAAIATEPSMESLELRTRQLLSAAYRGDKAEVASFFPGGEFPGGRQHSWNRQRIAELVGDPPKSESFVVSYNGVSGTQGLTLWHSAEDSPVSNRCPHVPWGAELCWRWMGGTWYLNDHPCWNNDQQQESDFIAFIRDATSEHCDGTAWVEAARATAEQALSNILSGNWKLNEALISKYNYLLHEESSWHKETNQSLLACQLFNQLIGLGAGQSIKRATCGKTSVMFTCANKALGKDQLAIPVVEVDVGYVQQSTGQDSIEHISLVREDGAFRIWQFSTTLNMKK